MAANPRGAHQVGTHMADRVAGRRAAWHHGEGVSATRPMADAPTRPENVKKICFLVSLETYPIWGLYFPIWVRYRIS